MRGHTPEHPDEARAMAREDAHRERAEEQRAAEDARAQAEAEQKQKAAEEQAEEEGNGPVSATVESCAQADSEAEPTPSPWVARQRENGDYDVEDVPGAVSITGQVRSNTGAFSAEAKANAELIAAAPDLLQAVKACRSIAKKSVSPLHRLMAISDRLDEVLNKYEGEA